MVLELLRSQEDSSYPQELFSSYYSQPPQAAAETMMSTLGIYMSTESHQPQYCYPHASFADNARHPAASSSSAMHDAGHYVRPCSELEDAFLYGGHKDQHHRYYCADPLPKIVLSSDSIQMQEAKQRASRSSSDSCDQILSRSTNMASQSSPSSASSWKTSNELEPGKKKRQYCPLPEEGMNGQMIQRMNGAISKEWEEGRDVEKKVEGNDPCEANESRKGGKEEEDQEEEGGEKKAKKNGGANKRKRNRGGTTATSSTSRKTREQVESQRMNHIAVERNRRRQMNEHLSVMRSLMPPSYVQRGDQASIIGGAIEFVKELEQILQSLIVQKMQRDNAVVASEGAGVESNGDATTNKVQGINVFEEMSQLSQQLEYDDNRKFDYNGNVGEAESSSSTFNNNINFNPSKAQVEVKMIGSWAMVKVLAHKGPHQLLNALLGLQKLHLKVMHLNVTTSDQIVLYSFHIQVNAGSPLRHVDDITKSIQSVFTVPSCLQPLYPNKQELN